MNKLVGSAVVAFAVTVGISGAVRAQSGTSGSCPAGTPASPRPAPDFVPTQDCMGWVPPSHPFARTGTGGSGGNTGGPAESCTVASLRGSYVFAATGFNIVAGVQIPKALVEVIDFNADGTLFVPAATLSVNGAVSRSLPSSGTYTLADNCTGTIAFNGPTFDIFLSRDGDHIAMIQTNPNTVFQGVATRTSR